MARRKNGRYRRKRYYRRYKSVPYNIFKARVETIGLLTWPNQEGQPVWRVDGGAIADDAALTWAELMNQSQAFEKFKVIFGYFKILGAKIQLTPIIRNFAGSVDVPYSGQVYAGAFFGAAHAQINTAKGVSSLDSSLMCNTSDFCQTYVKAKGEEARWHLTGNAPSGGIVVAGTRNAIPNTGPLWNFRIITYVAFKRSNV